MKLSKVYLLAQSVIAVTSHLSASELSEINPIPSNNTNVIVHVWNHDVGPVTGGTFMEHQAVVRDHVGGKQCGSGLFQIPKYYNENKEFLMFEGGFPLFDIKISLIVKTTDGKEIEVSSDQRLKLPGEYVSIDTGMLKSSIHCIKSVLKACSYGFTTGGGSVWIHRDIIEISEEAAVIQRKISVNTPIDFVASWPTQMIDHDSEALLFFEHSPSYEPIITSKEQLDPQWKKTLGLYVHNTDPYKGYGICFPTRGFNRYYDGASATADYFKLGTDFEFYAGHSLHTKPYPVTQEEWLIK
ncbi:MAG: hypothetical protein C0432_01430 [Candidatus Puniceispirillum sp.]|nr:hypothetical protein [Candidatus Pelagibacter sp.]MBA4282943.1 hypothetical protein [Candidatus Puniceispirillum sp.]